MNAAKRREAMVSTGDILQYLRGINFPIRKDGLLSKARDNNAPQDIMDVLGKLPDHVYRSTAEINMAVGDIE
jgi:hypothetical protein